MSEILEELLATICHRSGPHTDVLLLCLRCSAVYSGVFVGGLFEAVLLAVRRRSPGAAALWMNIGALGAMGLVCLGKLCSIMPAPPFLKVFTAFAFGAALAFFAVHAAASSMRLSLRGDESSIGIRAAFLLCAALLAALLLTHGAAWMLGLLGIAAYMGLFVAFCGVNLAVALAFLVGRAPAAGRIWHSLALMGALLVGEFALFRLWRCGVG